MSEVLLSNIDLGDRFDAEFFTKEDLKIEETLKKLKSTELRNYGKFVASAFYPAATHLYEFGDVPFIRCVDCIKYPLITKEQDAFFEKIPKSFIDNNSSIHTLEKGDIVITKVGTPSYPSIVYEHDFLALSRTVLGMKKIININPYYLLFFLRSKYGFSQLQRHRELTIQYQLTLERTKRTLVYKPTLTFQNRVEKLAHAYTDCLVKSQQLYTQAEDLLLAEVGLKDFSPSTEAVNIKSFSESFGTSGRLDAEYYQKKYDDVESAFNRFKRITLSELVKYPISSGITPKAGGEAYSNKSLGIPFIRAVDLQGGEIQTTNFNYIKTDIHNGILKRTQLQKDDVLFSIAGTVGRTAIFQHNFEANINQAIAILRFDEIQIVRLYLVVFFNSFIGKEYIAKYARQGLQTNLNLSEVGDLAIPIIEYSKQQQIAQLVEQSFALRAQSEQLLEVAKRAVEIAIEQDEATAIAYITEESKIGNES